MELSVSSTIGALQAIPASFSSGHGVSALSEGRFFETEQVGFHAVEQLVSQGLATMRLEADATFHSGDGLLFRETFTCMTRPGVSLADAWNLFINEPVDYAGAAGLRIVRTQRRAFLKRTPAGDEFLAYGGQAPATERRLKNAIKPRKKRFRRLTNEKLLEIGEFVRRNPASEIKELARLFDLSESTFLKNQKLKNVVSSMSAGNAPRRATENLEDFDGLN